MFEKATRLKLRFKIAAGLISTEDLWTLKLETLNTLAKDLNKTLKTSSEEDFIKSRSKVTDEQKVDELRFEIVKHVINIRLEELEAAENAKEVRIRNAKINEIIARKQDQALENLSVEELKALVK